jgi:hypothetical protein
LLGGADKAIEALVNIVAIGRSPVCIRTSSHLSAWSKILNPGMQTFTLNRPHDWMPQFPEAEIADLEALEARSTTLARAARVGPRAESVTP